MKVDDKKINIADNTLTTSGETKKESEEKGMQYHIRERKLGSFSRSLEFPTRIITDGAIAEFSDGVY